jgi:hypothetical protein
MPFKSTGETFTISMLTSISNTIIFSTIFEKDLFDNGVLNDLWFRKFYFLKENYTYNQSSKLKKYAFLHRI